MMAVGFLATLRLKDTREHSLIHAELGDDRLPPA
jgi:hypothetical protein